MGEKGDNPDGEIIQFPVSKDQKPEPGADTQGKQGEVIPFPVRPPEGQAHDKITREELSRMSAAEKQTKLLDIIYADDVSHEDLNRLIQSLPPEEQQKIIEKFPGLFPGHE